MMLELVVLLVDTQVQELIEADVDPSAANADFLDRLLTPPAGVLVNGANWVQFQEF